MREIRTCPVCQRKLGTRPLFIADEKRLVCPAGHSFDIAGGGYVNLLGPSAKVHGDNKAMVKARSALLDTGIYAPFRAALADITGELPDGSIIWDSGCGEGYYTAEVALRNPHLSVYGSDLSVDALSAAHRRCSTLILSAASSYMLPLQDQSVDAILCLFAPEALDEFRRILKPGGQLILGVPGKRHLFGLKEAVYDTPYENQPREDAPEGFTLLENRKIAYTVTLNSEETIRSLFAMTPYAYRTSHIGKARLESLESLTTELEFHLIRCLRNP